MKFKIVEHHLMSADQSGEGLELIAKMRSEAEKAGRGIHCVECQYYLGWPRKYCKKYKFWADVEKGDRVKLPWGDPLAKYGTEVCKQWEPDLEYVEDYDDEEDDLEKEKENEI